MNRTAKSGEIKVIKVNDDMYISSNESNLEFYANIEDANYRENNKLIDSRSRVLVNISHITHIENYKGTMRLIMVNGHCYIADNTELEQELSDYLIRLSSN